MQKPAQQLMLGVHTCDTDTCIVAGLDRHFICQEMSFHQPTNSWTGTTTWLQGSSLLADLRLNPRSLRANRWLFTINKLIVVYYFQHWLCFEMWSQGCWSSKSQGTSGTSTLQWCCQSERGILRYPDVAAHCPCSRWRLRRLWIESNAHRMP